MKIDSNKVIAIQVHVLCYSYPPFFKDVSILTKGNDFELKIMESLLIKLSSSISSCDTDAVVPIFNVPLRFLQLYRKTCLMVN